MHIHGRNHHRREDFLLSLELNFDPDLHAKKRSRFFRSGFSVYPAFMQIKEKVCDIGRFLFGSLLTCALILVSSKTDPDSIVKNLAAIHPSSAAVLGEWVRLASTIVPSIASERQPGSEPAHGLCWDLSGTSLDLVSLLDRSRFEGPTQVATSVDSTVGIALLTEAHAIAESESIETFEPSSSLECRYEELKSIFSSEQDQDRKVKPFALNAERLFCETIEAMQETNPAENREYPSLAELLY